MFLRIAAHFSALVPCGKKSEIRTLERNPNQHQRVRLLSHTNTFFRWFESLWWKIFFYFQKTFICNLSADWIGNRLYGTRLIIIIIFNYTRLSFVCDETLESARWQKLTSLLSRVSSLLSLGDDFLWNLKKKKVCVWRYIAWSPIKDYYSSKFFLKTDD